MGKIDFHRQGLDDDWTASYKSGGLLQSGYSKEPIYVDCVTSTDTLPGKSCHQGEHYGPAVDDATSSKRLKLTPQDESQQSEDGQPSGIENELKEIDATKIALCAPTDSAHEMESQGQASDMLLFGASEHVEDQMASLISQENSTEVIAETCQQRFPFRFARCFDGFSKLFQPARPRQEDPESNISKSSLQEEPHDAELEKVLLESASLYEAQEVSIAVARTRLQEALDLYNARSVPVEADGNCQFRALSQQLYGDESKHAALRQEVVDQLEKMPERYSSFVSEPWEDYVKRLSQPCEWGDNVTLQAASDMLGVEIHILNDQPGAERVRVHPMSPSKETKAPLCLAFLAELHYDAVKFL